MQVFFARIFRVILCCALALASLSARADSPGDLFSGAKGETTPPKPVPAPQPEPPAAAPVTPPQQPEPQPITPPEQPAPAVTPPAPKKPAPSGTALTDAVKLVDEVYADQFRSATTLDTKKALTDTLLQAAQDEKQPAGHYVLLQRAATISAGNGDLQSAFSAIDQLDNDFIIDALKLKADAAVLAGKAARSPTQHAVLAAALPALVDAAMAADRYDIATTLADLSVTFARIAQDTTLAPAAAAKVNEVRQAKAAYAEIQTALDTLATKPADPDANLKVGQYRCFTKGNWPAGLPALAHGSDPVIKALAAKEIAGISDADQQAQLADGWWNLAQKQTGIAKRQLQQHAVDWYTRAAPNLTGLAKAKAQTRIKEAETEADASVKSLPGAPRRINVVNLLSLIDPQRDAIHGTWLTHDGMLASPDGDYIRLQLPYHPPAEYDMRIEFIRKTGNDCVGMILSTVNTQFVFLVGNGNKNAGFDLVGGKGLNENPTKITNNAGMLKNGARYEVVVKVRKDGLQAFADQRLICTYKTDYTDMSLWEGHRLRDSHCLGLLTWNSRFVFSKVDVFEITGHGTKLPLPAPANFKWLDGTKWESSDHHTLTFDANHNVDVPGTWHGTWSAWDEQSILIKRNGNFANFNFSKERDSAVEETGGGATNWSKVAK